MGGIFLNKVCIFYFSGTGMTGYIVNKIKKEFEDLQVYVDCIKIENINGFDIQLLQYDAVGIAYPVHSFNAPQIVLNFVKRLPKIDSMETFIINTAGEDHPINYASSNLLIKKLDNKGFKVFYNKLFAMPSNFVVKYDDKKIKELINDADNKIPLTVRNLIDRISYLPSSSILVQILAFVGRLEWYGAHILGKFFYAKNSCTRCGKCVNNCPNHNIYITKGKVKFNWNCGLCMRCIYNCPEQVIDIHKPFNFLHFDNWYDNNIFTRR